MKTLDELRTMFRVHPLQVLEWLVLDAIGTAAAPVKQPVPPPVPKPGARMGIICPLYADALSQIVLWNAVTEAARRVPTIVVAPDAALTTHRAEYAAAFARVKAAGGTVLGYVHTRNGTRPPAEVKAEVSLWHGLYPGGIDGPFFDAMSTDPALVPLYQGFAAHARTVFGAACPLMFNPGTVMPAAYPLAIPGAIWLTSEVAAGTAGALVPQYSGSQYAALLHGASQAQMVAFVAACRAVGVSWLYCTSDALPNPWDSLPPYWGALVAAVEAAR